MVNSGKLAFHPAVVRTGLLSEPVEMKKSANPGQGAVKHLGVLENVGPDLR